MAQLALPLALVQFNSANLAADRLGQLGLEILKLHRTPLHEQVLTLLGPTYRAIYHLAR